MATVYDLHRAIETVCPIVGVCMGNPGDRATWRIDFDPSATDAQKTAAAVILAAFDPSAPSYDDKIAAGLAITSTGTPALNGTYAVDAVAVRNMDGIYSGIKGGDGLPGGGSTFTYYDAALVAHTFTADQFLALCKAVRDYLYALTVAAAEATPTWPAATATIA